MLKENVYDAIKQRIIVGRYKPGDLLVERELMQEYKIGKSPLREIFFRLQHEGFIRRFSRIGTVVSTIETKKLFDVAETRHSLEAMVAGLAVKNITDETLEEMRIGLQKVEDAIKAGDVCSFSREEARLHSMLYTATGNFSLKDFLGSQYSLFARAWFIMERSALDLTEQLHHWQDIYQALCERDEEKAVASNLKHFEAFFNRLKSWR